MNYLKLCNALPVLHCSKGAVFRRMCVCVCVCVLGGWAVDSVAPQVATEIVLVQQPVQCESMVTIWRG